jgi:hypothetical protein
MPKRKSPRRTKTTGTVIQNASGTWRARMPAPDGSRVSLGSFRTKTEAERALGVALGQQAKGSWINPNAGKLSFDVYAPRGSRTGQGFDPVPSSSTSRS